MDRNAQEELKAHLMQTDESFKRLVDEHCDYAHKLDDLASRPHLTEQEQIEEVRLKKLKPPASIWPNMKKRAITPAAPASFRF